jgi:K+-transporting ATPase KdpF subunit
VSVLDWTGLALAAGITVYLVFALLFPEKFQ